MRKYLLFTMFLVLSCAMPAQNLLVNPGFETWTTGKPNGWSVSNSTNISPNLTNFIEGTKSCNVNVEQANTTFSIYQNVAVTAGKTYTFKVSYFISRGDGTDARILSYFKNSAGKAIPMSLDDSLALKGPGGNNGYFITELGVWKTYTCNVVAPVGATTFVFYVRSAPYSNVTWDNFSFSVNTSPNLTISKTNISGFTYTPGNGPSAENSFTVNGSNLTGSLNLTAPQNYEISKLSGTAFTSSISLTPSSGIVNSTTIYIRLKSNLSSNTYTGNLSVQSTGVTTQNVALSGSVSASPILVNTSVTSLTSFTYNEGVGPSGIKSFTVSGSGLSSGITISAPENYEISIFGGTNFLGSGTFTFTQSNGNISLTTIYVRLKAGLATATYTGDITLSTNGIAPKTISLTGAVNSIPVLTVSTTSLSGFRYEPGKGPSNDQSFTVSGKGMTTAIIVTAPINYELSTETGTGFTGTSQLVLSQSGGIVNISIIYVRLKAGLTDGVYSGNLSLQTSAGISKNITLSGIVSLPLALNISANTLSGFSYVIGSGPSGQKSFMVSAQGLSSMLIITAPTNYEISTDGGSSFIGNNQIFLPINNGSVSSTTIYVRLIAGLTESESYTGNIVLNSGSEITGNIALIGFVNGFPEITTSIFAISDLNYWIGSGPSLQQTFTVSAKGLTSDLKITAPAGFEVSTTEGVNFVGKTQLTLNHTNGNISSTIVYVRLVSNLAVNTYSGEMEISSNGSTSDFISLNGNVLLSTFNKDYKINQIKIYTNNKTIYVSGIEAGKTIQLYSVSGNLILSEVTKNESYELKLLQNGLYLFKYDSKVYKLAL